MAITKDELKNLVKDAAKELESFLKAEPQLAKALEAKEQEKSPAPSPAPKDDSKQAAPTAAASTTAAAPAEPSTDIPGGEAPAVDGAAPETAAAGMGGGDFEGELLSAYESLDDDELCDHYMALKKVLRGRLEADAAGAAGGAPVPAPAAPAAPSAVAEPTLAANEASASGMSKGSASSMSKAEESSSSSSLSKESASNFGSVSHGSEGSLSKESPSAGGHKNGGETKSGKYPTGDAGAAPDKEPFPAHEHGQDYPVSGKKGASGKVEEGGTGRLEAVGKAKGSESPDRLAAVGQVSKQEEFEAKLELLTKAVEVMLNKPQRKSVSDRFELAKARRRTFSPQGDLH